MNAHICTNVYTHTHELHARKKPIVEKGMCNVATEVVTAIVQLILTTLQDLHCVIGFRPEFNQSNVKKQTLMTECDYCNTLVRLRVCSNIRISKKPRIIFSSMS